MKKTIDTRNRGNRKSLKVKTNLKAGWWDGPMYLVWRGGW